MAADLVAVNGDPTKDISAMRNIEAVIQAGSLVRADPPLV
jgi:imidazolonepropionase-like amidohydrolase